MKLGGIQLAEGGLGGWDLCSVPANTLPEQVATAVVAINMNLFGASYYPIRLVGTQVVNGTNYLLIAKEVQATQTKNTNIVMLTINIPADDITGEKATIVNVSQSATLPAEVQDAFDESIGLLHGVNYTPLLYVGYQVVKGLNYYIVCEAVGVYPGAVPKPVMVCINSFEGKSTVVSIEPIEAIDVEQSANAPLGEWP
jgi:hypothetical protein